MKVLLALCTFAPAIALADIPWNSYPRPQFVRESGSVILNGEWDYAVLTEKDDLMVLAEPNVGPKAFDGKITVPFPIESDSSGVKRLLRPNETLWYSRTIDVEPKAGFRTLLNFEGVSFRCQVYVNGIGVGLPHEGMYEPFSVDITDWLARGSNQLQVAVWNPVTKFIGASGHQALRPSADTHTRVSGIWRTVWMESVPTSYLTDFRVQTDDSRGSVVLSADALAQRNVPAKVEVFADGKLVGQGCGGQEILLSGPIRAWSTEKPFLYTARLTWGADTVTVYFAFREVALLLDENEVPRFSINGKFTYFLGVADYGWWPQGVLTPPSLATQRTDLEFVKAAGYNAIRLHGKVESREWYALCDRLGLLVLQDMPAGQGDPLARYGCFRRELKGVVDALVNVPSVVMWIPFHEGWGQPHALLTHDALRWLRDYEPTRWVDGPSGWNDFEGGLSHHGFMVQDWGVAPKGIQQFVSHAIDMHSLGEPTMHRVNSRRASFLGEYGHVTEGEAAVRTYKDMISILCGLCRRGLAGSVFRRLADTEDGARGLLSSDRARAAIPADDLARMHGEVLRSVESGFAPRRTQTLVPRRSQSDSQWAWTMKRPQDGWPANGFDDSGWGRGAGCFGDNLIQNHMSNARHAIEWTTDDLWVRTRFSCPENVLNAYVEMFHDEDVEVFLNGELILKVSGANTKWDTFMLERESFVRALVPGTNVLAAHVHNSTGGRFFDLGLYVHVKR